MTSLEPDVDQLEEVELLPSERNEVIILWADLQRKFGNRPDDSITLMEFVNEATNRFRELGFEIYIDPTVVDLSDSGEVVCTPQMYITKRVEKTGDHDHDRHAYEVTSGYEDGVEGMIGINGENIDRKKVL